MSPECSWCYYRTIQQKDYGAQPCFLASSLSLIRSSLAAAAWERWDMICPPHDFLISSARSLKLVLTDSTNLPKADRSSALTLVKATQEQFLRPTSLPSLDLPLTMAYGTPILRQRVGRKRTISTGSTSWAMTTNWARFFSTWVVTRLTPTDKRFGLASGVSAAPLALKWNVEKHLHSLISRLYKISGKTYLASDRAKSLAFLAARVSGLYFSANLKKLAAVCLSKV